MANSKRKCACGCERRERRELMLILGNVAFIDDTHRQAYQKRKVGKLRSLIVNKARKLKPKKKKLKSIAKLVDEAAVLLQKLVRMKAAIPGAGGMCQCVTCPAMDHWTNLQGGHFIQRKKTATKLMEENVHPQCATCNQWRMKTATGVLDYREYMVSMYGEQFVQDLVVQSKQTKKYSRSEVEGIIFDFKRQIQSQEARLAGRGEQEIAA